MSFLDDLAEQSTAPTPSVDVDLTLNGNLHTLRFKQMNGLAWAAAADKHPPRPDIPIDRRYGYNLRSLVLAVAPDTGSRVEGDDLVALTEDEWRQLFAALPGATVGRICDAVWGINEYAPEQAVEAAKKARRRLAAKSS
jgi:hypothetical protein